jgi:hypothetical protein
VADKTIDITWLIDQPGTVHGKSDQKRGNKQTVDERNGLRYIASGLAQRASKKELGQPYVEDPAALQQIYCDAAAQVPPTQLTGPEVVPIGRRPGF